MDVIIAFIVIIGIIAVILMIPEWLNNAYWSASIGIAKKQGEKRANAKSQERDVQMRKILNSDVFKNLENKIFSTGQYPVRIDWHPFFDKRVKVFLNNTANVDIYISDTEIPDVIDFMRALNYKYGSKYKYEESSASDTYPDSNGEYYDKRWVQGATLTLQQKDAVKVNSHW